MARRGKRTKLTPEVQDKIIASLSAGNYFEVACLYAGISRAAGLQWMQRGRGEHPTRPQAKIYVDFVSSVEKAQAEDETYTLARIKKAGQGGDIVAEEIIEEPDEIITHIDGSITERKGKRRTKRTYTRPEWTADAWRLERKFFHRWGRKERIDLHVFIEREAERIRNDAELTEEEKAQLIQEVEAYAYGHSES
jgi:hypothetical protein